MCHYSYLCLHHLYVLTGAAYKEQTVRGVEAETDYLAVYLEQLLKEQTVREVEAETDYLAVYLVQFGDSPLSLQHLREVRQYCLNDYRQLLVDRANKMQLKFDKVSEELQARHQWYDNLGMNASHDDEEAYVEEVRRIAFKLHTLELRLLRHKDLASARYQMLEDWLQRDPRMAPLYN
ncbi:dynein regulatory complex subunit 7-like [Macrosteles quadrilineatus]|uniref:dynein regulatory complex subunit 7-like n=1 Tax=Macrosteles quadrilineatus TaxID=74068 RepID=UPI0023E19DE1|nr:dynein regulatory complex subunit 7-like [Macrosteles quadrilineatus]